MLSTRIDKYFVQYSSGSDRKRIELRNPNTFAYLNFVPEGTMMPADAIIDGKKELYYKTSDFANCLDLLRNEKPCYLRWAGTASTDVNSLGTSDEAVGDGEASV